MKHVIIGTAGHVDHGKTTLVKALTGIDTDRLEEEKRRGVTIEPGFAYLDFNDGSRAGIIDVPGHERFIRNMLAGSGGVDLAMLVVAADEGVMPQTREHLGILTQLGINDGIVVVTKIDRADDDWMELVEDDIKQLVAGTFLEGKQVVKVSAATGDGITELKKSLHSIMDDAKEKNTDIPFRLPIDRVFPVDGFGIVVTGTLIEGSVEVGETAQLLPSGEKAPVRSLQVHGENAQTAYAGQRTAISLAGVKRTNVVKGDVLASEGTVNVSNVIDVKLNVLSETKRIIKNGSELHLYHGARTLLAKVFILDKAEVGKDEACFARLKLKEPLPCKRGDRFVVRFYSPMETLGGGIILDSCPKSKLSRSEQMLQALRVRELGSGDEIITLVAYEIGLVFSAKELSKRADIDIKTCIDSLGRLIALDEHISEANTTPSIIALTQDKYISAKVLNRLSKECTEMLKAFHNQFPLRQGMDIAELRQKLLPKTEISEANAVITALCAAGGVSLKSNELSLPEYKVEYSNTQKAIYNKLSSEFKTAKFDVKSPDELAAIFTKNEKKDFDQVLKSMITNDELAMVSKQIYWLKPNYDKAVSLVKSHFDSYSTITLAECRDILGTSRKYALAFLEHLDGKQVTTLQGEARKLAKGFSQL